MGNRSRGGSGASDSFSEDGSRKPDDLGDHETIEDFDKGSEEKEGSSAVEAAVDGDATTGDTGSAGGGTGAGTSGVASSVGTPSPQSEPETPSENGEEQENEQLEGVEPEPSEEEPTDQEDSGDDPHEPENPEDIDRRRPRRPTEDAEPDHDTDSEGDSEDDKSRDEEEIEPELSLVHYSDPYCVGSWQAQPILTRLEVLYGDEVDIETRMIALRRFDNATAMQESWEAVAAKHDMPIDSSVWQVSPPESSAHVVQAYLAARQQDVDAGDEMLRRLRVAALVEARDLTDMGELTSIAEDVGLSADQFQTDFAAASPRRRKGRPQTPIFHLEANEIETTTFHHPTEDLEAAFLAAGVTPIPQPNLDTFVNEYGPVAMEEVMAVYDWGADEAVENLQQEAVEVLHDTPGQFWDSP